MLRFLAEQKKIIPDRQAELPAAPVPVAAAPKLPQVHPGTEREVPAEYLNVVTGENLISFGTGG